MNTHNGDHVMCPIDTEVHTHTHTRLHSYKFTLLSAGCRSPFHFFGQLSSEIKSCTVTGEAIAQLLSNRTHCGTVCVREREGGCDNGVWACEKRYLVSLLDQISSTTHPTISSQNRLIKHMCKPVILFAPIIT